MNKFFLLLFTLILGPGSPAWAVRPTELDISAAIAAAEKLTAGDNLKPFRTLEQWVRDAISDSRLRSRLEEGLGRMLRPEASFEARKFACQQLAIIGGNRSLPELAMLLEQDENAGIACLALTAYPSGKADAVLREALPRAGAAAQVQILNTLGERRDAKAVPLLVKAALEGEPEAVEAAIASLGKVGTREAYEGLMTVKARTGQAMAAVLTEAMMRCAGNLAAGSGKKLAIVLYNQLLEGGHADYIRRSAFTGLLALDDDGGEQRIVDALAGSDAVLRAPAIAAVASVPSRAASEKFAALLPGLSPQEQVWMVAGLAKRNDLVARAAVAQSLNSGEAAVRLAAISAVGSVGGVEAVPSLVRALARSSGVEERRAVESALTGLGGGTATDQTVLRELTGVSGANRSALITVAVRRQGAAANPTLVREASGSDVPAAKTALQFLARTAGAAEAAALLELLAKTSDPQVRVAAEAAVAQALTRIPEVSRRSTLVRDALAKAKSVEARKSFMALLSGSPDAAALLALRSALNDPNAVLRQQAIEAMAEWPDEAAWDPLYNVFRQPENTAARSAALQGLVHILSEENGRPTARLIERYKQLLGSVRAEAETKQVLGALGGAAHPGALQLALEQLSTAGVRAEAAAAVKRIAEALKASHPAESAAALEALGSKN